MASASLFLLALPVFLYIFTTLSAGSNNSTSFKHSRSTLASNKILTFPVFHIGKFFNNHSQSLSLERFRLQNDQKLKDWMPLPFEVNLPLYVVPRTGEYFVQLNVGSQHVNLLLDNGSPLVWWQCSPCEPCFAQRYNSAYDPSLSTSYKPISCSSGWCDKTKYSFVDVCKNDQCQYSISYADKSYTAGTLARDFISNDNGMLNKSIAFGCGNKNEGLFEGFYDGILGFHHHKYSFPDQIEAHKYSFCLIAAQSNFDGIIRERTNNAPLYLYDFPDLNQNTTFVVTLPHLGLHYVEFRGIKINGKMVPVNTKYWKRGRTGRYGVILDTGTRITRFPKNVYNEIRDSFKRSVTGKKHIIKLGIMDTCFYSMSNPVKYIPKVHLCFGGEERELQLAPEHIMVKGGDDVYCLAFSSLDTNDDVTIIGSHQLQNTRLSFDMLVMSVSFTPNDC
ncbi:protein ASPARTIC PROTEASE IN GUARD CELL 1-like [Mercurialis annua]|uniref:protein ASPARTIC PROTEASE IN GUARD CELL 1-like n=1 Tax=Mercurialis annua TaxID=3986 RepID=UPI00215ECD47|nr:protein ASPARTIC PROTEASE IN GUARD CELL 1-like [Mercurialis annua]